MGSTSSSNTGSIVLTSNDSGNALFNSTVNPVLFFMIEDHPVGLRRRRVLLLPQFVVESRRGDGDLALVEDDWHGGTRQRRRQCLPGQGQRIGPVGTPPQ